MVSMVNVRRFGSEAMGMWAPHWRHRNKCLFVGIAQVSPEAPAYTSNMPLLQLAFMSCVEINFFSL
jgi:hypothetical protein